MAKMGRPPIEIDWQLVDSLCEIHCTEAEIAAILRVSIDTLARRAKSEFGKTFAEYFKEKSAGGKSSLRRAQYKKAMDGNPAMLIWLGKQWLGQVDHHVPDDEVVPFIIQRASGEQVLLGVKQKEGA